MNIAATDSAATAYTSVVTEAVATSDANGMWIRTAGGRMELSFDGGETWEPLDDQATTERAP